MTFAAHLLNSGLVAVSVVDGAVVVVILGLALFAVCMPSQRR